MTRYAHISPARIVFYELRMHWNHRKPAFHTVYRGSRLCKCDWFKRVCKLLWEVCGVRV